jgi:acetolactate synthase I/II/III large subunit
VARNVSTWIRTSTAPPTSAADAAEAVAAAMGPPGQVATLILPADVSWGDGGAVAAPITPTGRATADDAAVEAVAKLLRGDAPVMLFLGGRALPRPPWSPPLGSPGPPGRKLLAETFPRRLVRGAGVPAIERLAYLAEFAAMQLDGIAHLVLVDAKAPVSFFAYPGKDSDLVPAGCEVRTLAAPRGRRGCARGPGRCDRGARRRVAAAPRRGRPADRRPRRLDRVAGDRGAAARGCDRVRRGDHVQPLPCR